MVLILRLRSRRPRGNLLKVHSVTPFFRARARARERDERAASTCGIMVLIMCASGSYDRNLSPTEADSLRYDVSLRGVSQLITTLITRSLAQRYMTKIYCSQQPITILSRFPFFFSFLFPFSSAESRTRDYVVNGCVNYTNAVTVTGGYLLQPDRDLRFFSERHGRR